MSVRTWGDPQQQQQQLGVHWTDVNEISYLGIFRKSVEEVNV
jgi:hypothetical protein